MSGAHNPKARFGMTLQEASAAPSFAIADAPPLPAIDFGAVGKAAPVLLPTPAEQLPKASAVIITWAEAEWAALQHVFCAGGSSMPYSARSLGTQPGWQKYSSDMPAGAQEGWTYWGYYRLVQIAGRRVLLFKSNTHLDFPGAVDLEALIELLIQRVAPSVILSIGTAGGAKTQDHIGTVRAVSAGTLYETGKPQSEWPLYENPWQGGNTVLTGPGFNQLLFPIPTKTGDLESLCARFNRQYATNYTLSQLDPDGLNLGDKTPQIDNQTGGATSLLTASTFLVGNTAGAYQSYACIEMDDAVIGEACAASRTPYGFVRNISDPVQNSALPAKIQGSWGSAVYDAYGFYTSYNSAVAVWAMLA